MGKARFDRVAAGQAEERSLINLRASPMVARTVVRAVDEARRTLLREAEELFAQYAREGGFATPALARAYLQTPLSPNEEAVLMRAIAKLPEAKRRPYLVRLSSPAYRYRISHRQALAEATRIEGQRLAGNLRARVGPLLRERAADSFGRGYFGLQMGLDAGWSVTMPPRRALDALVKGTFTLVGVDKAGPGYTEDVQRAILKGMLEGKPLSAIGQYVNETTKERDLGRATAFARTAVTAVCNEGEQAALRDAGIDRYVYIATLDEKTCPVCGALDGKVFNVADGEAGTNLPPMHQNCRCTHAAALTAEAMRGLQRRGRDASGKTVTVPMDTTYSEWKVKFYPDGTGD